MTDNRPQVRTQRIGALRIIGVLIGGAVVFVGILLTSMFFANYRSISYQAGSIENLVPAYLVLGGILAIGIAVTTISVRWNRQRDEDLTPEGCCPRCRYDLRGNPEDEPGCPECGWNRATDHADSA